MGIDRASRYLGLLCVAGFFCAYFFYWRAGDKAVHPSEGSGAQQRAAGGQALDLYGPSFEVTAATDLEAIDALLRVLVDSPNLWANDDRYIAVCDTTHPANGWITPGQVLSDVGLERAADIQGLAVGLVGANSTSKPISFDRSIEGVRLMEDCFRSVDPHGARGWVRFWWPTELRDHSAALVRFSLGPVLEASIGTAFLKRTDLKVWRVEWIDLSYYL